MSVIAELLIEIGMDARDAEKTAKRISDNLDDVAKSGGKASKEVDKTSKALSRMNKVGDVAGKFANRLAIALGAVAGGVGALGKGVLGTAASFEKLRVQLKTATGSAQGAEQALSFVTDFAAKTPFQVEEITTAFVKLTNLGLTPSERALTAYGDTASAMGKELDQFIEAVADASNFEFERLRDFGITSKQQGDRVALTFKGVTTEVGKNAAEIEEFLIRLGEQNFGGAMAEEALTVGGAISNLQDTMTAFFLEVANQGPLEEFKGLLDDIKGITGERGGLAEVLGRILTNAIRQVRNLLQGDLVGTLEKVAKAVEFVVDNFDKLATLLVSAKVVSAMTSIAGGFGGIISAVSIAGFEIGKFVGDLIFGLDEAEERFREFEEKTLKRARKALGENREFLDTFEQETAKEVTKAVAEEEAQRLAQEAGAKAAQGKTGAEAQAAFDAASAASLVRSRKSLPSLLRQASELQASGASIADISAVTRSDLQGSASSAAEAQAAAEAPKKPRGGGRRAKAEAKPKVTSPRTVSEFFTAAARGELGAIAATTPSTADIEPTVAVDITNNNFDFNIQQTIDGKASPVETAKEVAKAIKAEFETRLSVAGQQLASNVVR